MERFSLNTLTFTEEVILAEERTTEEERMHIMEGEHVTDVDLTLSARRSHP